MPIALTSVNVAEVVVRGYLSAGGSDLQNCYNVYHFKRATTVVNPSKANIAAAFLASIQAALLLCVHADYHTSVVSIRYPEDADDQYTDITDAGVGVVATDRLPDLACVTTVLRTNKRGRRYQGMKHYGGVPEAHTDKDILVTVAGQGLAKWILLAAATFTGFTDSDGNIWTPVVMSRKYSQLAVNPTSVDWADVKEVLLNKNIGTMRSRRVATVR